MLSSIHFGKVRDFMTSDHLGSLSFHGYDYQTNNPLQQNYMSKQCLSCEICCQHSLSITNLSFCCLKVICDQCNAQSNHKCKNYQSLRFCANNLSSVSLCESCHQKTSSLNCDQCNKISLCSSCSQQIHSFGKFRLHHVQKIPSKIQWKSLQKSKSKGQNFLRKYFNKQTKSKELNKDFWQEDPLTDTSFCLEIGLEQCREKLKIYESYCQENVEKINRKWDQLIRNMENDMKKIQDLLKQKQREFIAFVQRKKLAQLAQINNYMLDKQQIKNIQVISQCIHNQPQIRKFLTLKIKNYDGKQRDKRINIDENFNHQYYFLTDNLGQVLNQVKKIDLRKMIGKNVCKEQKILMDSRASHPILSSCQTPQVKNSYGTPTAAKKLLNFFSGPRKTQQNIPLPADFSIHLGSPSSSKNITKIKSQKVIALNSNKNKTVCGTIAVKRAKISKGLVKPN